ncbi:MAG: hypothetical protein WCD35_18305 [Mycobacteriales bacterium]
MEKLDYLLWDAVPSPEELLPHVRSVTVSAAADLERPPLLMGRGPALAGLVEVWLDSVDTRGDVEVLLPGRFDGYLVTESVPQRPSEAEGLLTHLTWFPKPARLSEAEFFHGWHDLHTPASFALHPLRQGYVRDSVARVLTSGSPPVRAIVSEYFVADDYADPSRLFGSKEALARTMAELPSYGDAEDMSSRPLWRGTARS